MLGNTHMGRTSNLLKRNFSCPPLLFWAHFSLQNFPGSSLCHPPKKNTKTADPLKLWQETYAGKDDFVVVTSSDVGDDCRNVVFCLSKH